MYYRLTDKKKELNELRQKGVRRGYSTGFPWQVFPYTVKLGSTTYIASSPGSGKSELVKEVQINLSCLHGFNHVVFTPETGSVQEVFAEYCHSFMGKPYIKGNNSMSDTEQIQAEMFINEHFIIVDPIDEDLTVTDFYNLVDDIERDTGKKIHTTVIDPWNELTEQLIPEDMGREDKYVSRILGMVRKNARRTNRHHFIVTHVRDQGVVIKKGISYYPMPTAREFAGGQSWFRKGNTMIIPWRPPYGLKDSAGNEYLDNELRVKVAKAKPKGVAKKGIFRLFLDTDRYQYYYFDEDVKLKYADRGEYTYTPPYKDVIERMTDFQKTQQFIKEKLKEEAEIEKRFGGDSKDQDEDLFSNNSDEIPF
jgi:hypothetical protein